MRHALLTKTGETVPAEMWIRFVWFKMYRTPLDLEQPVRYSEKLQYMKLHWQDRRAISRIDKYAVRTIVADRIGPSYLNELFGIYRETRTIPWRHLPDRFVIKATHGSGWNIIKHPSTPLREAEWIRQLNSWLSKDYSKYSKEPPYHFVEPGIIVEKYLEDSPDGSLTDFKFYCFDGEPRFVQVDFGRYGIHRRNFYTVGWRLIPIKGVCPRDEGCEHPRPSRFDEMLEVACELAKEFIHVRIDLYLCDEKVVFGEITFFPGGGFMFPYAPDWNSEVGTWLDHVGAARGDLPGKLRKEEERGTGKGDSPRHVT